MIRIFRKIKERQFFRFLFCGSCSTLLDFVVYIILSKYILTAAAKTFSMIASSVLSYFMNKRITFFNKDKTDVSRLARYYTVWIMNLFANVLANQIAFSLSQNRILGFLTGTVCGLIVNYAGQKKYVFEKGD